jgi:hypothetical protein
LIVRALSVFEPEAVRTPNTVTPPAEGDGRHWRQIMAISLPHMPSGVTTLKAGDAEG